MWSLEYIQELNAEAAERSREEGECPTCFDDVSEVHYESPAFHLPFLGDACDDWDEHYTRLPDLFVDSTGFGRDDEPALTGSRFLQVLRDLILEHGAIYAAVREQGPFQVYVAVWI